MNPEVSEYISSIDQPWQRAIMTRLRKLVHKVDPDVEEKLKWGSASFDHLGPVLWVFCARDWVHISFSHGALLDESHGLFEPTDNKAQRTIKLREKDVFPEKTLSRLITQAVNNNVEGKKVSFSAPRAGSRVFSIPTKYEKLLIDNNLLESYKKRPYYQQSGWVRWIESAKQQPTKERRIEQMISELKASNLYMKMPW